MLCCWMFIMPESAILQAETKQFSRHYSHLVRRLKRCANMHSYKRAQVNSTGSCGAAANGFYKALKTLNHMHSLQTSASTITEPVCVRYRLSTSKASKTIFSISADWIPFSILAPVHEEEILKKEKVIPFF